jgi:hypothetical protein
MQKDDILAEMKRTARDNGGRPLGRRRFQAETGISDYEWSKYWPKYSDLQRDAGCEPNRMNVAYDDSFLLDILSSMTISLGHFPTQYELRQRATSEPGFPNEHTFRRLGKKQDMVSKILIHSEGGPNHERLLSILGDPASVEPHQASGASAERYGFVYLVRGHPGEYKIGHTNLVDRRLSELGATASVEQRLIHEIKTDDPAGVEAYWHRRFDNKRMRGEWFRLNAADVRAFKRWRRVL